MGSRVSVYASRPHNDSRNRHRPWCCRQAPIRSRLRQKRRILKAAWRVWWIRSEGTWFPSNCWNELKLRCPFRISGNGTRISAWRQDSRSVSKLKRWVLVIGFCKGNRARNPKTESRRSSETRKQPGGYQLGFLTSAFAGLAQQPFVSHGADFPFRCKPPKNCWLLMGFRRG
jgi:hypothetical protein